MVIAKLYHKRRLQTITTAQMFKNVDKYLNFQVSIHVHVAESMLQV